MSTEQNPPAPPRTRYVRAIGPRLRILLWSLFGLAAVLAANSIYLGGITFLEWTSGETYQNYFYQYMFLVHLALGLLLVVPFLIFIGAHLRNTRNRPNRRAVRVGYAVFFACLVVLVSGIALMRVGDFKLQQPAARSFAYWAHIISPLAVIWLYILHRLAGPRIKWAAGGKWAAGVAVIVGLMIAANLQDPRDWHQVGPEEGAKYFEPSLARTSSGGFIPAHALQSNEYCMECHQDAYDSWFHSSHHFSSFNNPAYLHSVEETREVAMKRDGNVTAARWCAGCHDPVPFFSGAFDDPNFDLLHHPTSQAGITCVSCHAITHVNSTRGNADYTIEEPIMYPFTYSKNRILKALNLQLVKAKPDFHKKTFLKPLHQTSEFCSTCHKVSIPFEVNHYKDFLRGQNHYDSFLLSGVSGIGARSFYYPEKAMENCSSCHMGLTPSADFGAKPHPETGELSIHDHLFPGANTGIAHLQGLDKAAEAHRKFLEGCARVDIFGIKEGGTIRDTLVAPLRPAVPELVPGKTYLLEVVVRTLTVGHLFTQGTADSNEVWLDAKLTSGERIIGRSGGLDADKSVDPWAHFLNIYMLDREGNRIDRRNVQDIFTPLYNHQIPPGAARISHYSFTVPEDQSGPLTVEVKLQYRKFDTTYVQHIFGPDYENNLPITTIASDRMVFPVAGTPAPPENPVSPVIEWQRWNDYGIGLFLEGDRGSEKGQLRQAEQAFGVVEELGRPDGPMNLARVFLKEGRLDDAAAALTRAHDFDPPAPRWTLAWFNGQVDKQNGHLDKAITSFRSILEDRYPELDERGFDFSKDYEVINELGVTLFERSKMERGEARRTAREDFLRAAVSQFEKTLAIDSENTTAHYNLSLLHSQLGDASLAEKHRSEYERLRPDDNARDRAIELARRSNPAADNAAQSIAIYPLQRPGAPELPDTALATDP